MPSWVSFTDNERLQVLCSIVSIVCSLFYRVGDSAKNAFHSNPTNTVFDAKRLIGRNMDDQNMKQDIKHWPFQVKEKNGKPSITVQYQGESRDFVSPSVVALTRNILTSDRLRKKSARWFS
jgi:heat shock protein 5